MNCPQRDSYPKSYIDQSHRNFIQKKSSFSIISPQLILVPVSNWLSGLLTKSYLCNCRIRKIHNGIDLKLFKPQSDDNKEKFVILGVANVWDQRKGLADFIKLSDTLSDRYKIILIGLSEKQIKSLPINIQGIRRTENINQLIELYSMADVFINPTWEDNFPTTNIEAMACGTPVITYRTGGSPEAIDSNTGIVVEQGDVQGLKKAIETIRTSSDRFTPELCRARAEKYFNQDDRFEEYFELYEKIINKD